MPRKRNLCIPPVLALALVLLSTYYGDFLSRMRHRTGAVAPDESVDRLIARLQDISLQPLPELERFDEMGTLTEEISEAIEQVPRTRQRTQQRSLQAAIVEALKTLHPWWRPLTKTFVPWQLHQPSPQQVGGNIAGITICAGTHNLFDLARLLVSLRDILGSISPIEIAYVGDNDLNPSNRTYLAGLVNVGLSFVNLEDLFDESIAGLQNGTWAVKPFAILASSFAHVLLLDADAVMLQNPDRLFHTESGYLETGLLFFHDRAEGFGRPSRHGWFKDLMVGRQTSAMLEQSLFWKNQTWQEMESGIVMIDKTRPRAFASLLFTAWMNTQQVRDQVTGEHVHGDKETYWMAAELSSTPYHFNPDYAGVAGLREGDSCVCGFHLLHLDVQGRPLWYNGGLRKDKTMDSHELEAPTHWMSEGLTWVWGIRGEHPDCGCGGEVRSLEDEGLDEPIKRMIETSIAMDKG